jgi:hypothetical protein
MDAAVAYGSAIVRFLVSEFGRVTGDRMQSRVGSEDRLRTPAR